MDINNYSHQYRVALIVYIVLKIHTLHWVDNCEQVPVHDLTHVKQFFSLKITKINLYIYK